MSLPPWSLIATALALTPLVASAADENSALRLSGFASATVGKVTSGSSDTSMSRECPCFVADWGQGASYGPHWQAGQESRLGVQADYKLGSSLSATAQVVARGVDGVTAGLEWAYLTYRLDPNWTVQAGRKRLPLYFYSEFQDVGYAYNWVRPPGDVYGWEVVNYNGVNLAYSGDWGDWNMRSSLYLGGENADKNRLQSIYTGARDTDVRWHDMVGVEVEASRDWLTLRANANRMKISQIDRATGVDSVQDGQRIQTAWGLAANVDQGDWLVRSEYGVFDRSHYAYVARFYLLGVGYRIGAFTPMITTSGYSETYTDPAQQDSAQRWKSQSAVVRWDFAKSFDMKVQYDRVRNSSVQIYNGSVNLWSLSLDTVF